MGLVDADALAMKLRHMGYMDENEEIQEVIDRFAEECNGDLISRQAAIDAVIKRDANCGIDSAEVLKALPSVQPELKKGKWIRKGMSINCSVCKKCSWSLSFEDTVRRFNYCPNCGAKMEGEEDGQNTV